MDENNIKEFKEVAHELVGWDKRVIRTIRNLVLKPGFAVQESISQPEKYISPWVYFFTIEALGFYAMSFGFFQEYIKGSEQGFANLFAALDINWKEKNIDQVIAFLQSEIGYKLFIPFLMILRWLFFKKFVPSFKSNCFFVLYMSASIDLVALISILFWYAHPPAVLFGALTFIISLFSLAYLFWGTLQFYRITLGMTILWTALTYTVLFIFKFTVFILVAVLMNILL